MVSPADTGHVLAQTGGDNPPGEDGGKPEGADKAEGDKSPSPRNPWSPEGETPPRRMPGIEDIFRQRRPTGPGEGGGNGGGSGRPPGPDLSNLLRLPPRPNGEAGGRC
jgi:hypothetical protein